LDPLEKEKEIRTRLLFPQKEKERDKLLSKVIVKKEEESSSVRDSDGIHPAGGRTTS